jgi:hypothetical protein
LLLRPGNLVETGPGYAVAVALVDAGERAQDASNSRRTPVDELSHPVEVGCLGGSNELFDDRWDAHFAGGAVPNG